MGDPATEVSVVPSKMPSASARASARQPMFWAVMAFSLGLYISHHAWRPPSWWLAAALALSSAAVFFLRRKPAFAFALTLFAFVFAGALAIQTHIYVPDSPQWLGDGDEVVITAHVTGEGNLQSDDPGSLRQHVDLETEQIESQAQARNLAVGLRLNIYLKSSVSPTDESPYPAVAPVSSEMQILHYGQRIHFSATLTLHAIFATPAPSTMLSIFVSRASSPPHPPSIHNWRCCQVSPVLDSGYGVLGFVAALLIEFIASGRDQFLA
jgi:hypothetical protein